MMEWARWLETHHDERVVEKTALLHPKHGSVLISTVFLGLDHNFTQEGPPLIFETMIFGGKLDQYQDRCSTWDEAIAMHAKAIIANTKAHEEDNDGEVKHSG